MDKSNQAGKTLSNTKEQTPFLPTIVASLTTLIMWISIMCPTTDIILSSQVRISNGLLESCVRADRAAILWDLEQWWIEQANPTVRGIQQWSK